MAHPPAIQASTIPAAIDALENHIANIKIKNTTMIGWYIHPDPTPSAIVAYEPRINVLSSRLKHIDTINVPNLTLLLNDATSCIATYLYEITTQLATAINGFQTLFIEHYDPTLGERLPYLPIFQALKYLEGQLVYYVKFHRDQNPNRRPADRLLPPPSTILPSFCRSAVSFINNQDHGRITQCLPSELIDENRARLRSQGGVFVWWECEHCAFRLRFHITNSNMMSINATNEIRSHTALPELEYRSSWLAKCHLYHFGREEQVLERERRRRSALELTFPGLQRRYSSSVPVNTYGVNGFKYGCIICFAAGDDLGRKTCFSSAAQFAKHLNDEHGDTKDLPPALMLEAFKIGVKGEMSQNVRRWDINFQ